MEWIDRFKVGGHSDVGLEREKNEDCFAMPTPQVVPGALGYDLPAPSMLEERGLLFVIADGMGGHAAGEVASRVACEAMTAAYYGPGEEGPEAQMQRAVQKANLRVIEEAKALGKFMDMGTTLTAVALFARCLVWGHVGDCRLYLLRPGLEPPPEDDLADGAEGIRQLSEDHTEVMEWLGMKRITKEQARQARHGRLIRAVGIEEHIEVDTGVLALEPGDRLLLCSDGLHGMVRDAVRLAAITAPPAPVQEACQALVQAANAAGGEDNSTALLIEVESPSFVIG